MSAAPNLDEMPTEEAAEVIWDRMRAYMKEKGGKRATDLFKEIDKDRSGKIDADEFKAALVKMGIEVPKKKVIKAIMKTADPNGDGELEYKELLAVLKQPVGAAKVAADREKAKPVPQARSASPVKKKPPVVSEAPKASGGGMFGVSMPELPSMGLALPDMPDLGITMPDMPDLNLPDVGLDAMAAGLQGIAGQGVVVDRAFMDEMPTEEAAEVIWDRMRAYMKEKGGKRATDLFKEIDKDRSGKIDADEFKACLERMEIPVPKKKVIKAIMKTADPNGDGELEYKELLAVLKAPKAPKKPVEGPKHTKAELKAMEAELSAAAEEAAGGGADASPVKARPSGGGARKGSVTLEMLDVTEIEDPEEKAQAIWARMHEYMKEKGGTRAKELFAEMDTDRSGKIDAKEFKRALEKMSLTGLSLDLVKKVMSTADPNGDGELDYKELMTVLKETKSAAHKVKMVEARAAVEAKREEKKAAAQAPQAVPEPAAPESAAAALAPAADESGPEREERLVEALERTAAAAAAAVGSADVPASDVSPTEREVHRLKKEFRRTLHATALHNDYLEAGFVPLADALASMQRYRSAGYNPLPGDVVEMRENGLKWSLAIVTKSRNVAGKVHDDDVSVETWLNTVQDGWGSRFGPAFRIGGVEDLEDLKGPRRPTPAAFGEWLTEAGLAQSVSAQDMAVLGAALKGLRGRSAGGDGGDDDDDDDDAAPEFMADVITSSSYRTGLELGNDADELRPPNRAVRAIYGDAPYVWVNYALLQAEDLMRFHRFHPEDFQEIKWKDWGVEQFNAWLNHAQNSHFRAHYDRTSSGERAALLDAVIEPFEFFEKINTWDFDDGSISCYSYLSMLGQGWLFPVSTIMIQCAVPILLLLDQMKEYDAYIDESDIDGRFCPNRGTVAYKFMIFCMMLIFVSKVVPDNWDAFYSKVADGTSDSSKMMSLRKQVWELDEDTLTQKIGYRVDVNMSGPYVAALFLVNVAILFMTNSMLDIVLNALAIEFIAQLDEVYVNSAWWDKEFRYLKAGAIEMAIRRYLELQRLCDLGLNDPKVCAEEELNTLGPTMLDAELESLEASMPSHLRSRNPHRRDTLASVRAADAKTKSQRGLHQRTQSFSESKMRGKPAPALFKMAWKFIRQPRHRFLDAEWFRMPVPPIFGRYWRFRCWSKWTKDGSRAAMLVEPAVAGAEEATKARVRGAILFPCAARMECVARRKERVLEYEAAVVRLSSRPEDFDAELKEGDDSKDDLEAGVAMAAVAHGPAGTDLSSAPNGALRRLKEGLHPGDEELFMAYRDERPEFAQEIIDVLTLRNTGKRIWKATTARRSFEGTPRPLRVAFFFVDGVVSWLATVLQIAFPVIMFVGCFFLIPFCY